MFIWYEGACLSSVRAARMQRTARGARKYRFSRGMCFFFFFFLVYIHIYIRKRGLRVGVGAWHICVFLPRSCGSPPHCDPHRAHQSMHGCLSLSVRLHLFIYLFLARNHFSLSYNLIYGQNWCRTCYESIQFFCTVLVLCLSVWLLLKNFFSVRWLMEKPFSV